MRLLQLRGQEPRQRRLPEVPPDRVQEKLAVHRWRGNRSLDRSGEKRKPLLPFGFDTFAFLGEMGSPLVVADTMKGKLVKGSPTEDLLVGIKSFGTSDPEGKTCAVYTSVSFFRTWIMKTIGGKTKPSRCMLVPKAELEKGHHPVLQQPEPISPVPEAESEQVTESPVPEVDSEPVTESPAPEAKSEPVAEPPAPEADSEPVAEPPAPEADSEPVAEPPAPEADSEPVAEPPAPEADSEPVAEPPAPEADSEPVAEPPAPEADSEPVAEPPAPEADSEPVAEPPAPEADSEPVAEPPAPEAKSEPVAESPAPEAKSEPVAETSVPEVDSEPVAEPPAPEADSEPVAESPAPEAKSEPVAEPAPEADSEPVAEPPAPEAESKSEDRQPIDEFRSLTEEQQIQVGPILTPYAVCRMHRFLRGWWRLSRLTTTKRPTIFLKQDWIRMQRKATVTFSCLGTRSFSTGPPALVLRNAQR